MKIKLQEMLEKALANEVKDDCSKNSLLKDKKMSSAQKFKLFRSKDSTPFS